MPTAENLFAAAFAEAIRASMSIPGVFSPIELDGKLLVDGGVANNVPVDIVRAMGADVVIDAAGYEATWALALGAVRTGGRIEEVGLGSPSGTVDFFAVLGKEAAITGSYAWGDADFDSAVELMRNGAIDVSGWITTMPLADGQRAFQELVGGAGHFKVVLTF
jgi:threonine dehydrogenase-like Zn-dependent dehydrogenase